MFRYAVRLQVNRLIFTLVLLSVGLFPNLSLAGSYVPPLPPPPPLPGIPPLPPPPPLPGMPPLPPNPTPTPLPPNPTPTPPLPPLPPNPTPTPTPTPPLPPTPTPVPTPTPTPTPTPLPASGQLAIWTDGFMTPITSGRREINVADNINLLEWTSSNAVSCEGDSFNTAGASAGSIGAGNPSLIINSDQTKIFAIRCKNSAGVWSAWRLVELYKKSTPYPLPNTAPDAPDIRGADMSTAAPLFGINGIPLLFTIKATDPDGDNIRYQLDWDNNGSIDQLIPGTGYVASALPQSTNYTWMTGSYTFKVRAQDDKGNYSLWTSHTINVSAPAIIPPVPPLVWLEADATLVRSGGVMAFRAKVIADYAMPCVVYGVSSGTVNFNHNANPNVVTYSYATEALFSTRIIKIICTPNIPGFTTPSVSDEIRINVVPSMEEV